MIHPCPHCQKPAFSDLQKLTVMWLQPKACPLCHKASFLPVRNIILVLVVWTLLTWVFIGIAFYMRNVLFMLGTIPAAVLAVDIWIRRAPLQKFN